MSETGDDVLAVLLLPARLEEFDREDHARGLLSIPRVIALEPSRVRAPRFMQDSLAQRQARRLRFPGRVRMLVLYHPAQYPLARAMRAHDKNVELWYVPPGRESLRSADAARVSDLAAVDQLARERATRVLTATGQHVDDASLRDRLSELGVINQRAFLPAKRSQWPKSRLPASRPPRWPAWPPYGPTRGRPGARRRSRQRRPRRRAWPSWRTSRGR
jgi:hypothetical protein